MTHDDRRRRILGIGAAVAGAFAAGPLFAAPGDDPPSLRVRVFYEALLDVMKQAVRLGLKGRFDRLAPVIHSTFDLPAMTRIAVGSQWNSISREQQGALVDGFSRMTVATYASRFDGYSGERFEVDPVSEARATGRIVHTRLVQANGTPLVLDYLLRNAGATWTIVDVYLTGAISELATRRSEFAAILGAGGPPALVQRLGRQADALLGAPAPRA